MTSKLTPLRRLLKLIHPEGLPGPLTWLYNAASSTAMFQSYYVQVTADVLDHVSDGSLLDVGTGPGRLLKAIHERAPGMMLTGIDLSPSMVSRARQNIADCGFENNIRIELGSAESIPFPADSFDIVVSTASIHHWKDPEACLNEIYRVLKPGRHALLYDIVSDTPAERLAGMKRRFGRLRTLMLYLHALTEPFYSMEAFASLPASSLFKKWEVKWTGILCCLVLKKD